MLLFCHKWNEYRAILDQKNGCDYGNTSMSKNECEIKKKIPNILNDYT